ncbi:Gfo/Idh/MocA family protein [Actinoplanes aureus]|uniref:Gfo/Idh/MocA family oxidoreductase n=1 Tax=Actinoplanes aureus TaxID=2792083 RepID=A0A931C9P7_9ACTN|nr:Gfo/Idh/MocA family oxidoreductase [Actinoplanes aureus]MBG0564739.1 Gfo/Idh/MocA family oxidoreductase [Actinoplanes aureus]
MTTAAVIGCGDVSVVHLGAIGKLAGVTLVGVCDTDTDRGAGLHVPRFTDHRRLLDEVRPDVVHICTPHDQHTSVAVDCLEAGVNVLLEKPVAHTVAEADRLIDAARRHPHLKVGICLQNRYNTATRTAYDLLSTGGLGPVVGGSATVMWHRDSAYYQARPWRGQRVRSGGGVLINQAVHTVDLLEWLLGDVTGVCGQAGRYALDGIDVEDTASMVLDHAGGARSVLFATVANAVDSPVTIEITTKRATLLIRGDLTVSHAGGRVETIAEPVVSTGGRGYWGASHELLIADFYRTLPDPAPFWIGPQEGARSLRLIDQIYHP